MSRLARTAAWLDRKQAFRYRLWEFSLRNAARFFPWYFLFRVLAPHPVRALRGALEYVRLVGGSRGKPLEGTTDLQEIRRCLRDGPERLVIAPGFCMKPYSRAAGRSTCPAGHANHDCRIFDAPSLLSEEQDTWPDPCSACNVGALASLGAGLKADFYIMTSALDIARDLFLPAMKGSGARLGVFLLCPYSSEAFSFGLAVCGLKGSLITFQEGNCRTHEEWTRADVGIKNEQTFVRQGAFERLKSELLGVARSPEREASKDVTYVRRGNVYRWDDHSLR